VPTQLLLLRHRSRDRNFTPILALKKPFVPGQENNYFPSFVVIVSGVPAADLLL
jgi:hypothetical protein